MRVKKHLAFIWVLAIAVLILDIIGCERIKDIVQPPPEQETFSGEIAIGVVTSQTGVLGPGEFGPGASVMENGFSLALEEINASKQLDDLHLKFIIEDDQSSIEGAIGAFEKLIHEDKVSVILGVWTSHIAASAFPIAQENNVVAMGSVLTATGLADIGDFVFRVANPIDVSVPKGIATTHEQLGYQQVAIIADTVDVAARSADETYQTALATHSVEVLTRETFETGETDFSAQLSRIKASNPDVVFLAAQDIETILILQQAREMGIDVNFIRFIFSIDNAKAAGDAAEGVITFADWVATAETSGNKAFVANYTAKYGSEPSVWAGQSYATVHILAEALSKAQSTDPTAIVTALSEIKDFPTILGDFSFAPNGDPIYDPVVLIVRDGRLEVFE